MPDELNFALNYYSLATIITSILTLSSALFFGLIPNKSDSTKVISIVGLTAGLCSVGYVWVHFQMFESFWPRILLLLIVIYHNGYNAQMLFRFPTNSHPRAAKTFFWLQFTASTIAIAWVAIKAYNAPISYDFSAHFFELTAPREIKVYGIVILVHIFLAIGTGIWKTFKVEKDMRLGVLGITLGFVFCVLFPGVANILNKTGVIDRGLYITVFSLFCTLGFFLVIITYINHTSDRTSFMFKVIGTGFVVFMVIFSSVSYVFFKNADTAYDKSHVLQTKLAALGHDVDSEVLYMKEFDVNSRSGYMHTTNGAEPGSIVDLTIHKTVLYEKIRYSQDLSTIEDDKILSDEMTQAYWEQVTSGLEKPYDKKEILKRIKKLNQDLFYDSNQIKDMPVEHFKEEMNAFLIKKEAKMPGFVKAIRDYMEVSNAKNAELKKEVMLFYLPLEPQGTRLYRLDQDGKRRYVAYHYVDFVNKKVYEVAYSYGAYRKEIHNVGVKLFGFLIVAIIAYIVGTPIFLSRALVKPLHILLEGVGKVKEGDLSISVPIKVHDEIGYLAGSFNQMVSSIRESEQKLKDYADHLEEKVDARTKELQLTLHEVEKLKEQQDGDYFLTTLLLRPLGMKKTLDTRMKVDFFVKQKKEFTFKKQKHQIGGDICISQALELRGKKYIVFLNADAMGKSIQGAGGILVLGAVFQSIMQRTQAYRAASEVSPERWIKMAFKEMHKIFESFDGSMLVSLIFGLVEDSTGVVYYINAEHPWLILYRDGKADFIEHDMSFRKLGHCGVEGDIYVSTFQMMPGDLLVIGSDGKDDLVIGETGKNGERIINEDEDLFLTRVEEAGGDISKIFDAIRSEYELIDDFSLMSIHYPPLAISDTYDEGIEVHGLVEKARELINTENNFNDAVSLLTQAYEKYPHRLEIVELLIKVNMKMKNFKVASDFCREYLSKNEVNTSVLFKSSYCLKMSHEFEEAIDLSERVKLREPRNIRNLLHLADLYAFTRNFHRAEKIIKKIQQIEPDNKMAQMFLEKIEKELIVLN